MDITILFKACIKTARTTNKTVAGKEIKTNILRTSRDPNLSTPKAIIKQVGELHVFLMEHRIAYLNVVNYLSTKQTMNEVERQQVDSVAQKIITSATSQLSSYKEEIAKKTKSRQKQEHYASILDSVEKYLKAVSKIYTEAKAIRVKRVIEAHKLSKLETKPSLKPAEPIKETKGQNNVVVNGKKEVRFVSAPVIEDIETKLSAEEMQMFEEENDHLFNELNNLSDEVKQIESKVVHISELQELFTEKVLQQERDIDRIATTVASSTDNVKDANEQIRQAIQRNAGLRVWVLFFLLVMSFSLLFLDWYND